MRAVALGFCLLIAAPAGAENVYDSHFGKDAPEGAGCYIREYGARHLAAHPDQWTEFLSLSISPLSSSDRTVLGLMVKLRDDPFYYHVAAVCARKGAELNCRDDAGFGYVLGARDARTLRLTLLPKGLRLAGSKRIVTLDGRQGDDRSFLLPVVVPEMCN